MLHFCAQPSAQLPITASFDCRRVLENSDHFLVEVKRADNTDFLNHFHWLKISKDFTLVETLHLKAIDSSYQVEERFFEEGYLKFNNISGIFIEKFNSGQHQYQLLNDAELHSSFLQVFESYFFDRKILTN